MLFNSWTFGVFFALFFPIYLLLRKHVRARNVWLLVCSYAFYGWWNPRFVTLLAILAAVDYLAALGVAGRPISHFQRIKGAIFTLAVAIGSALFVGDDAFWLVSVVAVFIALFVVVTYMLTLVPSDRSRKAWLLLSIFANLGVLTYFKYCNFFLDSVHAALVGLGLNFDTFTLKIILPIGLSFHVFQGISRTVDCYRGTVRPEGSLTTVATYLAFFPQLVAGPIERAKHLIPQFETVLPLDRKLFSSGALLFVWGLYQKLVVADNVAPIANAAFAGSATLSGGAAVAGILAFTVQIYCDFCGYSNMARGLARCLGFDLMANFNLPYFARTPSEFWRRWHISLSTWLRDYLYFALGGNRLGQRKMYRNLMLTMLLGGLWHGAAWTFVVWGAFHGAIQVVYRFFRVDDSLERLVGNTPRWAAANAFAWFVCFVLIMIGWVFFRATSFEQAGHILMAAFGSTDGYSFDAFRAICFYALPLTIVETWQRFAGVREVFTMRPFFLRYSAVVIVIMTILLLSAPTGQDFIYFDF